MQVVIIGAGQAGHSLAFRLRKQGFIGDITLIGEEPVPPYQRPPLSKKYLLDQMSAERLQLKPSSAYEEAGIALRLGQRVESISADKQEVTIGGEVLAYDKLALTTGSVARHLPASMGGDLAGVFCIRTLTDIDAIKPHITDGKRVLIVGGGYIGLEAAAVAAQRGMSVVLIEAGPRILGRVACAETASYFRALHQSHGVDIREGIGLAELQGGGHVERAILADGTVLDVDVVITGIGIDPAINLAEAAGLELENGITVDSHGRSSDPHIFAAGDCASFSWQGRRIRLESVQNAIDQAEAVADAMLDQPRDYAPVPWFWSDQYDVTLQIVGLNTGYNEVVSRAGARAGGVSHWYFRDGQLLAVDAMNDARAYMIGKRLLESGKNLSPAQAKDPSTDLKALL